MNQYFALSVLIVWLVYLLITRIFGKTRIGYRLIVLFVFLIGYGYLLYDSNMMEQYLELYSYALIALFLFFLVVENLSRVLRKSVSEIDFQRLEKELNDVNNSSELLRNRFISTIELLQDGISFRENDGSIFGSDRFIHLLGLESNQFDVETFEKLLLKEDLIEYKNTLEKTSKRYPKYSVKYRIKKGEDTIWINEIGKRIILDKETGYISLIKPVDIKAFPESEIEVLNSLENEKKLYKELLKLSRENKEYHLILIRLSNIPKINEKYGRDVGDLMMGEYIKKLQFNFIKDNQSLFRVGGIDFGLIIKDERKYEVLERALQGSGELLNMSMVFGGVTQTLYPNLGIAESPYISKSPDQMLEEAKKALEVSTKNSMDQNYCFFEKI